MPKLRLAVALLTVLPLLGCANAGYYAQAFSGQLQILSQTRSIDDVLADPHADAALKEKLTGVLRVRAYASRELGLPDNNSYRAYADVGRPYVLWNVFATPEFSLTPREWCFVITGCVAYRGYFTYEGAQRFAAGLREQGFDVYVGGVTAYSTLGWLRDPVLNTIIDRPAPEVAGLMFHELAHQRLYVRGDTTFSESFAMTVEQEGMRRWLKDNAAAEEYEKYEARLKRRDQFVALVLKHRDRLESLYQSNLDAGEKRAGKAKIFAEMRQEYERVKSTWGGAAGYDGWFAQGLNNSHLVSLGAYHHYVPSFQALLARHKGDMAAFYRAVEDIGRLPAIERTAALDTLLPTATVRGDGPVP